LVSNFLVVSKISGASDILAPQKIDEAPTADNSLPQSAM